MRQAIALKDPRMPFHWGADSRFQGLNNTGVVIQTFDYRDPLVPGGKCYKNVQYLSPGHYADKWLKMEDRLSFSGATWSVPMPPCPCTSSALTIECCARRLKILPAYFPIKLYQPRRNQNHRYAEAGEACWRSWALSQARPDPTRRRGR